MSDIGTWFSTRWDALHWAFRILVVPLAVIFTTATLMALIITDWEWAISAYGSLFACWLFVDWNYWRKFGSASRPVADFGSAISKPLLAAKASGKHTVTIRLEGNTWTINLDDTNETAS